MRGVPDGPPTDKIERTFQTLNLEAFPSSSYAHVDDILVRALFATKHCPHGYRALHPKTAGDDTGLIDKDAISISKIIKSEIKHDHPTKEDCKVAAMHIWCQYHSFLLKEDLPIIKHLLLRYALLHSIHSSIKVDKVTLGGRINAGLTCTKLIPAPTYILTSSGSMSLDDFGTGGLSVIMRGFGQLGPEKEHLILGPLRFVNHECKLNCQIRPIKNSHAHVLF
ncbi:hypothetical protein F5888DRAFT_1804059 [Russula emetica]|nr:hypothetical protein F5888DRAFT_1804059 [Russula emetica]